ncbi:hypothetical protein EPI10_007099 [Gossypium australe]|uniref:Gag-pro-like protein n=1 Tax=Gossypium australe TaxID=47621 RepID=A0A5B6WUP5_9ROSI|nr:hypothetical protein EPI10_007099 [Gossypium australe]
MQQDMKDQMLESQRNMMNQLAQLLAGGLDKGKSPVTNPGDDNEEPLYPSGYTPTHTQVQPDAYPQRVPVTIMPQYQAGASVPMNFPTESGSNLGDHPTNPVVPDLDDLAEMEKERVDVSKQLEDRCKWLEEKFKAMENVDYHGGVNAKDLSLPDRICGQVVQPAKPCSNQFMEGFGIGFYETIRPCDGHSTGQNNIAKHGEEAECELQTICREVERVMSGEMIENAIRSGKIDAGERARRPASRKNDNEVNNVSTYNKGYIKPITMSQPRTVTTSHQGPPRELYQNLFDAHVVSPFYIEPLQPPFPKWYDAKAQCEYHAGIAGHSIENCIVFKKLIERFIKMGIVKFDDPLRPNVAENPLPNHSDKGVNAIVENGGKRIKVDVAEVKTPLRWVWKQMVNEGLIMQESGEEPERVRKYCEFHADVGHDIQECIKFRVIVQNLMDNKEMEFYEEIEGSKEGEVYASEEGSTKKVYGVNHPVVIILRPRFGEAGVPIVPKVIIQKPVAFPYKDSKSVLWNYDCNVMIPREENPANTSKKEAHRSVLMKVLNETYVAGDISVNKLNRLVGSISAGNFIFFNDDEIPLGGMGSTKALHITTRCKGYTLPGVLVDNGSALNVLPLSTLNRLPVDSSHMKTCQNIVRAFDGTKRRVMGRIEILLQIGPNTYEVDFLIVTINAEEDIIASVTNDAPYIGAEDEAIECSFRSLEFVNATFIVEGNKIPMPKISKSTRMGLQMIVGKGALPRKGLRKCLQGKTELSKTFVSGGTIYPEQRMARREVTKKILESLSINAVSDEGTEERDLSGICPYTPGSVLNNWTMEEIPVTFRINSK